jgi:hypothetical protein
MACPTNAIEFGLREELMEKAKTEGRERFDLDQFSIGPSNIFLKPMPRRQSWDKL